MTKQDFENKKEEYGIIGTGIDSVVKKTMTWTDKKTGELKCKLEPGTKVHLYFSPKKYPQTIFIDMLNGTVKMSRTLNGFIQFSKITKQPSMNALTKMDSEGIVKSVTGHKVEPDGYGPDGSPSWMLVLGMI